VTKERGKTYCRSKLRGRLAVWRRQETSRKGTQSRLRTRVGIRVHGRNATPGAHNGQEGSARVHPSTFWRRNVRRSTAARVRFSTGRPGGVKTENAHETNDPKPEPGASSAGPPRTPRACTAFCEGAREESRAACVCFDHAHAAFFLVARPRHTGPFEHLQPLVARGSWRRDCAAPKRVSTLSRGWPSTLTPAQNKKAPTLPRPSIIDRHGAAPRKI